MVEHGEMLIYFFIYTCIYLCDLFLGLPLPLRTGCQAEDRQSTYVRLQLQPAACIQHHTSKASSILRRRSTSTHHSQDLHAFRTPPGLHYSDRPTSQAPIKHATMSGASSNAPTTKLTSDSKDKNVEPTKEQKPNNGPLEEDDEFEDFPIEGAYPPHRIHAFGCWPWGEWGCREGKAPRRL